MQKHSETFDPVIKMVKVNPGSTHENIGSTQYSMLYTKFQGHQNLGSGEEDFWSFSPYMGMVKWPVTFENKIIPYIPWRLHMKFDLNRPSSF